VFLCCYLLLLLLMIIGSSLLLILLSPFLIFPQFPNLSLPFHIQQAKTILFLLFTVLISKIIRNVTITYAYDY